METPLVVTGVVAGNGLKAPCRIKVQVLTGPFFTHSPFTACAIEEAPREVPGLCSVLADWKLVVQRRKRGFVCARTASEACS